jgi:hypothetical protein
MHMGGGIEDDATCTWVAELRTSPLTLISARKFTVLSPAWETAVFFLFFLFK